MASSNKKLCHNLRVGVHAMGVVFYLIIYRSTPLLSPSIKGEQFNDLLRSPMADHLGHLVVERCQPELHASYRSGPRGNYCENITLDTSDFYQL